MFLSEFLIALFYLSERYNINVSCFLFYRLTSSVPMTLRKANLLGFKGSIKFNGVHNCPDDFLTGNIMSST